ncbi:hypothetical protein G7054_g14983 [Neopestalotiopsis clavispora]|nr:hypothetical protein G7054_g14983 [Neopestalotiopsis clavispora]
MAIWGSAVRYFGTLGPLWLILYLGFSSFSVFYFYCHLFLLDQPEHAVFDFAPAPVYANPAAGWAITVFLAFLKFYWFGSWVMALTITHFMDRDWLPHTRCKTIMQGGTGFPPRTTARWEPNVRPRICPRCLPIFDHYCPWLLVSVYSRTIKAYLYTLLFLFFDILGTFVVIVMALTTPSARSIGPFVATGVFALVVLIFGVFMWGPSQWWHLALNNEVYFEHRNPKQPKFLAFKVTQGGRDFLYFDDFVGNPWDRGYMNNLRQVLGSSWWMWLMFWWQPERVARYGRYEPDIDLPFSDEIWAQRNQVIASFSERRLAAQFWSGSTAPPPRPRRVQSRSAQQASPIHGEESSELRRRMIRTS